MHLPLLSPGMVVGKDAPLIEQLRAAHGVVLGKVRMHELAEGYTSISAYYGAVLNPYQVDMHVGGMVSLPRSVYQVSRL